MTKDEVLAKLREEIAEQRRAADAEPDPRELRRGCGQARFQPTVS